MTETYLHIGSGHIIQEMSVKYERCFFPDIVTHSYFFNVIFLTPEHFSFMQTGELINGSISKHAGVHSHKRNLKDI